MQYKLSILMLALLSSVSVDAEDRNAIGQSSPDSKTSATGNWRSLPLTDGDKIHPDWVHVGLGGFTVKNGTLRAECRPEGWGLLVYKKEKFGNCQFKVVYRCEHPKANSGVFVRLDGGILKAGQQAGVKRNEEGELPPGEMEKLKKAAAKEAGAWYAVSHGFEVQIQDEGPDAFHRTGAVYSFAKSAPLPHGKKENDWRTMLITLNGSKIFVEIDDPTGRNKFLELAEFDSKGNDPRAKREWYLPKWGKRPISGYIGLQNHDPGDVVYFREVSVRPLR